MVAGGKLALASAAPGYFKKESEPVITGDRKVASISCIAFCHPFHGLHNIFVHNRGCARCAGLPLPFIFYPLARAQNSAGVRPRIRKTNYFSGVLANQLCYKNLKAVLMKLWDTCVILHTYPKDLEYVGLRFLIYELRIKNQRLTLGFR